MPKGKGIRKWMCSTRDVGGNAACGNKTRVCEDELVDVIASKLRQVAHLNSSSHDNDIISISDLKARLEEPRKSRKQ